MYGILSTRWFTVIRKWSDPQEYSSILNLIKSLMAGEQRKIYIIDNLFQVRSM